MMELSEREFWMVIRKALLMIVDIIERKLELPRTAQARRIAREEVFEDCST